jgi:adenosylmethionine-8-amino-7-oxononanoate aminotransferase
MNGFTYQAHPTSCAAALSVQTIVKEDNLLARAAHLGKVLQQQLEEKIVGLPHVGNIRGAGLFWGVEFVKDTITREPFEKSGAATTVANAAFSNGVQVYVCEGVADGIIGDAIIFAPAYNCDEDDIRMIVEVVASAIRETVS